MAQATITKRIHCKRAICLNTKDKQSIQAKLSEALSKSKKIGSRKETIGENNNHVRAIIYHRAYANMLFGILASYERGTHQLTVTDDDDAEMLTVEQVAPPATNENKRQEFLEGVCYFCIAKNHVVVVPSSALGAKALEFHLNWILLKSGLIGKDNQVGLCDQIAQATRERIRAAHVKTVEIGKPLIEMQEIESETKKGSDTKFEYKGVGLDMLRQILGKDQVNKLKLADAVDGNIEVTLQIRYKRVTTNKAHDLLDNIALAIRNLDEDEVKLKLVKGGTVKGSELKLSAPLSVQARDGIPNPDELFKKMREWLIQQIENHIIEP